MLRSLLKTSTAWRSICMSANRFNKAEQSIPTPITSSEDKQRTEYASPPYARPFVEINAQENSAKEVHYDVGEFVDSLEPPLPIAFNLAAYVNRSESLQNLVRLGVDLSEIENKPNAAKFILKLDFEANVKPYVQFLHDHGVNADDLGRLITKNVFLFKESIEDLEIRINYLKSKRFDAASITRILTRNPFFLTQKTTQVDSRLGFFQKQFSLSGNEVRYLITKNPKLITCCFDKFREQMFVIKEELGYNADEMKQLLLAKPKIWLLNRRNLKERFDIAHNTMGLSHERILEFPGVLLKRGFLLKQRHLYLTHLGRAQYDPTQPLFVSLADIATTTDSAFCEKCAKTSVDQYNEFLRTI